MIEGHFCGVCEKCGNCKHCTIHMVGVFGGGHYFQAQNEGKVSKNPKSHICESRGCTLAESVYGEHSFGPILSEPSSDSRCPECGCSVVPGETGRNLHRFDCPALVKSIGDPKAVEMPLPEAPREGPFYYDGINYVFQKEPDGNSRMICEIRGFGDGMLEENAKMIVEALNGQSASAKEVDVYRKIAITNEAGWKASDAEVSRLHSSLDEGCRLIVHLYALLGNNWPEDVEEKYQTWLEKWSPTTEIKCGFGQALNPPSERDMSKQ